MKFMGEEMTDLELDGGTSFAIASKGISKSSPRASVSGRKSLSEYKREIKERGLAEIARQEILKQ